MYIPCNDRVDDSNDHKNNDISEDEWLVFTYDVCYLKESPSPSRKSLHFTDEHMTRLHVLN